MSNLFNSNYTYIAIVSILIIVITTIIYIYYFSKRKKKIYTYGFLGKNLSKFVLIVTFILSSLSLVISSNYIISNNFDNRNYADELYSGELLTTQYNNHTYLKLVISKNGKESIENIQFKFVWTVNKNGGETKIITDYGTLYSEIDFEQTKDTKFNVNVKVYKDDTQILEKSIETKN